MTSLPSILSPLLLLLLLHTGQCEYDWEQLEEEEDWEFEFWNNSPDHIPDVKGIYLIGEPNENCLNACWRSEYGACLSNAGSANNVIDALYRLVPDGYPSLKSAIWSESYHPIVEADGTYVGWESLPAIGGKCDAYPPDFTQRRLCLCSDTCEDTFRFCRALRYVCDKYDYTRRSCPLSCGLCDDLGLDEEFMP